jgi:predicted TIM-barrel fold metal-dependent hydrolase
MLSTIDACVTIGNERETSLRVDDLLRQMDRAGVQRAIVQPADRALAVDHRRGNHAMIEAVREHPTRFIAACTANPWFGPEAVAAIRDAIADGARMAVFAPSLQGFILGDELLFPLLDVLAEKRLPVYIHTGPHLHSSPWQLVSVAERYPMLSFLMGHCGATDFWNDVPLAAAHATNVYLEASFARPFGFKSHLEKLGRQRGIMGSGAPSNDLEFEWAQMREMFPANEFADVYGETMQRLIDEVRP